jgi:hypothetical protein
MDNESPTAPFLLGILAGLALALVGMALVGAIQGWG